MKEYGQEHGEPVAVGLAASGLEVEAAPEDITISVAGPRQTIVAVDQVNKDGGLSLLTSGFGVSVAVSQLAVAIQVDSNHRVLRVMKPPIDDGAAFCSGAMELAIPAGGYVLFADLCNNTDCSDVQRFLACRFKAGDIIKLRLHGEIISVRDLSSGSGRRMVISLDCFPMFTVTGASTAIRGAISDGEGATGTISLSINGASVPVHTDGSFAYDVPLESGVNYVTIRAVKQGLVQDQRELVIYRKTEGETGCRKPEGRTSKEVFLWIDQTANAKRLRTSRQVRELLEQAKIAGVTSVVLDVKGVEGFVSHKKNYLTGRPYVSEVKAKDKAGANPDLDLLEEFVQHGHSLGLKVHASFNVFAEGSIYRNESAILDLHPDWEERVCQAEDGSVILPLRESAKPGAVVFVNPAHEEVRAFALKTFEEVIRHYDIDGIVHDRSRYDNEFADFSELTRARFAEFLAERGKTMGNWPDDVFRYEDSIRVNGPLIQDWWEFRSSVIHCFFRATKELVDAYKSIKGREIQVSAYVGSWYEKYYLYGVNWGSCDFTYDARLGLQGELEYTEAYRNTSYLAYIDFLMIGTYQTTLSEVGKYMTLGNIVTNGEIPLYAGIALSSVSEPELQRDVFQTGLSYTDGLMLFDAVHIDWPVASAALSRTTDV